MLFLLSLILLAQVFAYLQKRQAIGSFRELFPDPKQLGVSRYRILATAIERTPTDTLLTDIDKFNIPIGAEAGVMNLNGTPERMVPVALIGVSNPSKAFTQMVYAMNAYLLRNSVATLEYPMLEGIAERHSETLREKIRSSLAAPLQAGILGVFAMAGFFFYMQAGMPIGVILEKLLHTAHYLLLPLFVGLLLGQLLRGAFYQSAFPENSRRREAFYTFLQTGLLPLLNPAPEGTLRSLQNQMQRFGQDFSANLSRLDGLLARNYDALLAQSQLLDSLRNADLVAISGANVSVLQELRKSTGLLSGFNTYLTQVDGLLQNLQKSVEQMNVFLTRTGTIEDLAGRALAATAENRQLMAFLQSHYRQLDESRQVLANSVVDVNRTLQSALDDLQRFTLEKIDRIRAIETYESERLSSTETADERRQLRETLDAIHRLLQQRESRI